MFDMGGEYSTMELDGYELILSYSDGCASLIIQNTDDYREYSEEILEDAEVEYLREFPNEVVRRFRSRVQQVYGRMG